MGVIRSAIMQWILFNGGKIDKSSKEEVDYLIPVGQIDRFFQYLRECLDFSGSNMFVCKFKDGYMVVPRCSIEQNIVI